jgi:peptidoglycan/xylan/chitin deacetylase (PgdA/CDA1 family)
LSALAQSDLNPHFARPSHLCLTYFLKLIHGVIPFAVRPPTQVTRKERLEPPLATIWQRVSTRAFERASWALRTKTVRMENRLAIASFTFDDFPRSAVTNGARILQKYNIRGTFFAAGSLCNITVDGMPHFTPSDLAALSANGHEIGCHTFHHVPAPSLTSTALKREIAENAAFVRGCLPHNALRNFSYPFGEVSPLRKLALQQQFTSCRGIQPGLNRGVVDLGLLKAERVYGHRAGPRLISLIKRAAAEKAWLIFYTHDVDENPTRFGCTPALFEQVILMVCGAGIRCLTVEDAVSSIQTH